MTTPEAPDSPTPQADAAPPAEQAPEPEAAAVVPVASEAPEQAEGGAEPVTGEGGQGAAAPSPEGGERKRRRRRRRKKGAGPHAEGEAGAAGVEPGPEGEGVDAGAEDEGTAEGGEADRPGEHAAPKRDRKKEKRHGPPRERPPVNMGDIVFGKILEITDDAIIIDLPGKAHAIFDRLELLIGDDEDEPARHAPEPAAAEAASTTEATATPEIGAAPPEPTEAEAAEAAPLPEAITEAVVEPTATAASEAQREAAAQTEDDQPSPEAPRDPKIPRVVLEVGADFIAVVHNDGARGGLVVLTHHPRRADRARAVVEKAFHDKTTVLGLVTGVIKGGIEVDLDGLRAFAPGSHVDLRLGADLSHLVAKRLPFLVTQYAKRGRDLVLSRRPMLEEEAKKNRAEALARLKVGEEIDGVVRSVVSFGAFIDVGGIEGLVPLQEMSHNRADGPSDVFKAGEATRVRVTKIDEKGKIWLSRRATIADPWQEVAQKFAQGTRHTGKVARLQPFGVFVELEPGVDGLIHLADLSLKRIEDPSEIVKVGDSLEVVVSHVEPGTRRIALHPALQGAAADEAPQRIAPHKPVKGKVIAIESGGLVVRILGVTGRNARGYVTAAGTGTPRGTELRKAFNVGQDVEAKVIEMDPRRGEVKLSIKALGEDQERNAYQQYRQQLKAEARFTFGDLLAKKSPPR